MIEKSNFCLKKKRNEIYKLYQVDYIRHAKKFEFKKRKTSVKIINRKIS